jgi:integrase
MAGRRSERPRKRTNPSGDVVWVARWTDRAGHRHVGWPGEIAGTYRLRREAQDAIERCYDRDASDEKPGATVLTVGGYVAEWLGRHPRTGRTAESYAQRVRYVLGVELDGRAFSDWPIDAVARRQANELVDHMLRVQGRAADGARGVLRVLSAMWQDAIDDEAVRGGNPFMGLRIRSSDPRVVKAPRRTSVWSWEQMHGFAAAAAGSPARDAMRVAPASRPGLLARWDAEAGWRRVYAEPMIRTLADVGGLRLGELLALERGDVKLGAGVCGEQGCDFPGPHLHVRRTAYRGRVSAGTKTDHGEADAGRQAPIPDIAAALLGGLPARIDTRLLFPSPDGRLFRSEPFYRLVWNPARVAAGMAATPHEFRHSYVSLMRAAGVDPADLARWTGHTVLTATTQYTHSTGASVELGRRAVSE